MHKVDPTKVIAAIKAGHLREGRTRALTCWNFVIVACCWLVLFRVIFYLVGAVPGGGGEF